MQYDHSDHSVTIHTRRASGVAQTPITVVSYYPVEVGPAPERQSQDDPERQARIAARRAAARDRR